MKSLYLIGIKSYALIVQILSPFNPKAKSWIKGRENWRSRLRQNRDLIKDSIWIHAASLGELEQAIPLIKKIKAENPSEKIFLSFFSPSGYENFRHHDLVDYYDYLPIDSPINAKDFIGICQPKIALFIKYEIWPFYLKELQKKSIPQIIAPALFRANQIYFKPLSRDFFLPILKKISSILVQDQDSFDLLNSKGFKNIGICGESRFDRVVDLAKQDYSNHIVEEFASDSFVVIGGSTWPKDEYILKEMLVANPDIKLIIAPHEVDSDNTHRITQEFKEFGAVLLSVGRVIAANQVLIIDNIGQLSKIYRFANLAFIGGGFGQGLHSTLEAAVYGMPIFFGPNHKKFKEPQAMINAGFAFEIDDDEFAKKKLDLLLNDKDKLTELSNKAREYVNSYSGATEIINAKLHEHL